MRARAGVAPLPERPASLTACPREPFQGAPRGREECMGRQPRPAWFGPAPYRMVRVREDHVQEWLARLVAVLKDEEALGAVLRRLWAEFERARTASLDALDLQGFDSWSLVQTVEAGLACERAIEEFLPEPWATRFPPEAVWLLFMYALLIKALDRALEDPFEPFVTPEVSATLPPHLREIPLEDRVLLPALRAEFDRVVAAEAKRELLRRGGARRGFPGAVILYLMRAERAAPRILTEADVDVELATEDLVTQVMKLLARRGGRWVWPALRAETQGERRAEATGEAPLTLDAWAKSSKVKDELEILARALEGELDVIPLAVARDLQNRAKPEARWAESLVGEEEIRITIEEETPPDPAAALDSRLDAHRQVEQFVAAHPRHRVGIELALSDASLTEAAAKRGVTVSALSQRRTAAIRAFNEWVRGK